MQVISLRSYQYDVIERLRAAIRCGRRRLVCGAPTGAGKTIIGAWMVRSAVARGLRCLFLAHREELIDQTYDKLVALGITPGVIMASDPRRDDYLPVQVASVPTLARRMDRLPPADLIIVDECHHSVSASWKAILDAYPKATIVGLTATPWRTDKIGLADYYEELHLAATTRELMDSGALVECDYYAYDAPDLHSVKVVRGDYDKKGLALACNTDVLVGNIVSEYRAHAAGRPFICFPASIAHSKHLVDEFNAAGFPTAHVDCYMKKAERKAALDAYKRGDLVGLCSVGVLTEGFDAPRAEVGILARPTKSIALHIQMIGRLLRPSPETGKLRALIHDHAGNLMREGLGFADDERDYSLTATPEKIIALHTCPACNVVFRRLIDGRCPGCNEQIALPPAPSLGVGRDEKIVIDGRRIDAETIRKLRKQRLEAKLGGADLTDAQIYRASKATPAEKFAEYKRLIAYAQAHDYKLGWATHAYRATFGKWPAINERDRELYESTPAADRPFFDPQKS